MEPPPSAAFEPSPRSLDPFRRAVLRGLGVLLPPLLTVVIFLWVGSTIAGYVLTPLKNATRHVLVEYLSEIREADQFPQAEPDAEKLVDQQQDIFYRTPDGLYIPGEVYQRVERDLARGEADPPTARDWYRRYVDEVWLQPWIVIPIFLSVFLLLLYTIGKFLAAGIGHFAYRQFESLINRLPLVSNVYTSVKQVTDFLFKETELDITRIVAVEYPRRGIWTVAFVTGDSMLDIESAANEPVMTVLIPTSPMPFTGFTITVKKSETVDLNITIDQAFQFIVSCGVVVPSQQTTRAAAERDASLAARPASTTISSNGASPAEVRQRLTEAIERQTENGSSGEHEQGDEH